MLLGALGNRLARLGYAAPKKYVKQNKDLIRFLASSLQKPFIYSMKHNEEQWQGFRLAVHAKLTDERLATMPTELATACRHVTPLTSHTANARRSKASALPVLFWLVRVLSSHQTPKRAHV